MNLIYRKDNNPDFNILWKKYVDENKLDFHYSLDVVNYTFSYISDLVSDESFIILQDGKCAGICICPIEKKDVLNCISINGGYVPSPLFLNEKVKKKIYNIIDEMVGKYNIDRVTFFHTSFNEVEFNNLLEFGFIDTSTTTCNVSLLNTSEILWRNLRKSYKSLINSLIKDDKISIIYSNEKNLLDLHDQYVQFHKQHMRNAGKEPKSDNIYNGHLNLLKNGLASIIAVKFKDEIIVTNYFFHNSNSLSYASSAYNTSEEFSSLALVHYLLWNAILYFKNKGYKYINFGQPCGYNQINGLDDYLDDKQISISSFKRGMGAEMKTLYRGIKLSSGKIEQYRIDI